MSMEKYSPLINEDEEGFERGQLPWDRRGRRCYQIRPATIIIYMVLVISLSCNLFFLLPTQDLAILGISSVCTKGTHWVSPMPGSS